MDDGVRLAADVYLPPGTPTDGFVQVPCLVELSPYRKELRAAEGASLVTATEKIRNCLVHESPPLNR